MNGPGNIVRPLFRALSIPASGLSAQRARLDAIASNIANAETTRSGDGGAYRRRIVAFQEATTPAAPGQVQVGGAAGALMARVPAVPRPEIPSLAMDPTLALGGVRVDGIFEVEGDGPLVYEPGHPDADAAGYVRYPNVRMEEEMISLMEARRAYEANATVFQAAKAMLRRALEI